MNGKDEEEVLAYLDIESLSHLALPRWGHIPRCANKEIRSAEEGIYSFNIERCLNWRTPTCTQIGHHLFPFLVILKNLTASELYSYIQ